MEMHTAPDYAQSPLYVYWEMTQVCGLACRHCRATSKRTPDKRELSTDEGRALIREVARFGAKPPILIFSGGDPLSRPDLYELIDEAHRFGIPTAVTPSATPTLGYDDLVALKEHNVSAISMSLDGSTAQAHDGIRNVPGTFAKTLDAAGWAQELELPLMINTLVSRATADDLPSIYRLLTGFDITRWSLFFLISVGRGRYLEPVTPQRAEEIMNWMYATSLRAPFIIGATEAPEYRRIALGEMKRAGMSREAIAASPLAAGFGVRDGNGVVFVSKTGDVYPTGFLPLSGGNVRDESIVDIYRDSPLFVDLHDDSKLTGKCGVCDL